MNPPTVKIPRRAAGRFAFRTLLFTTALACGTLLLNGGCKGKPAGPSIAVIPKGATHEHWQRVKAGAEQAGKEFGVNIIWKAPQTENDRDQQIKLIEGFTAD